jgi:hypothetical protein
MNILAAGLLLAQVLVPNGPTTISTTPNGTTFTPIVAPSPTALPTVKPTAVPTVPAPTPKPTAAPTTAPALSGTITGINTTILSVNGGGTRLDFTNAIVSGTPSIGGTFAAAGSYVQYLARCATCNFVATSIQFGAAAPTPTASSVPTGAPTALPATGSTTTPALVNGQPIPAGFLPYAPTSIFNTPLLQGAQPTPIPTSDYVSACQASAPGYDCASSDVISIQFPSDGSAGQEAESANPQCCRAMYFAKSTDPTVNVPCPTSNCVGNNITTMQIPALAQATEGTQTDTEISVIQPDGTEDDLYCFTGNNPCFPTPSGGWKTGDTVPQPGYDSVCSNYFTGSGFNTAPNGGEQAGGQCSDAGAITLSEAVNGGPFHAIIVATACTVPGGVAPFNNQGTNNCSASAGPQLGSIYWSDIPCATIQAMPALHPFDVDVMCDLNLFGGYVADDGAGSTTMAGSGLGFGIGDIGGEPFVAFGTGDPFSALTEQGWTAYQAVPPDPTGWFRYQSPWDTDGGGQSYNPPGINFQQHMHIVKMCVVQRTC